MAVRFLEDLSVDGDVGIGTTSPSNRLEIVGPYSSTPLKVLRHGDYGNVINIGRNGVSETANIGYPADATLNFSTSGFERMRIDSSGNVGIGTASPSNSLHVQAATANAVKINNSSSSSVNIVSDNTYLGLYPASYIILGRTTLGYADLMFLKGKKLRWQEADNSWYDVLVSDGSDNLIKFGSVGDVSTGGDTAFYHDASEKMRLTSTGLGIGTTNPAGQLDIRKAQSTTAFTDPFLKLYPSSTTNTTGLTTITLGTSPVDNYGVSLSGWRYGTDGTPKFVLKMHQNSAAGIDALTVDYLGNVGVGTTSPVEALNVGNNGNIRIDGNGSGRGIFASSNGSNNTFSFTRQDGVNTADLSISGYGGVGITGGRTGSPATSGYSLYVANSGNVGIGTTSPQRELHVHATNYTDIQLTNDTTGAGAGDGSTISATGNDLYINNKESGSLLLLTNNSERVRVTSSGNVGIGTTSPDTLLEVSKSTGAAVRITSTATGNGADVTLGSLEYYGNDASVPGAGIKSSIVAKTEASLGDDSNLIFSTSDGTTNNIERLRINSSGDVGIGTTGPVGKLTIIDTSASSTNQKFHVGRSTNAGLYITDDDATAYIKSIQDENAAGYGNLTLMADDVGSRDGYISFNHSDTGEKMRIDSSGNVGIGTTSPDHLLQVESSGNAEIQAQRASGAGVLIQAQSAVGVVGTNTNHRLDLKTNSSTRATISTSGNFGVGITSPSSKLHVMHTDASIDTLRLGRTDNNNFWRVNHAGNDFRLYNDASSGSDILLGVDAGGSATANKVGIGTASPTSKLHISESASASTADLLYLQNTGSGGNEGVSIIFNPMFSATSMIASNREGFGSNATNLSFHTCVVNGDPPIERMRIASSGNVGIGTTSPDSTLDVNGAITLSGSSNEIIKSNGSIRLNIDSDNNQGDRIFIVSTGSNSELFRVDEGGHGEFQGNATVNGSIELGHASDTTIARASAGKVTIEGAPIQTTQMSMSHHNFYFNTSSTTIDYFVPFNSLTESSNPTITNYYGRMVAPYDGRIVKAVINTTAAIGTACSAQFWVATSAGVFAPSPAETVSNVNLNTANTAATATFSGTSTAEFSEGDVVGLSIQKSGTTSTAYIQVTIVWEYTV